MSTTAATVPLLLAPSGALAPTVAGAANWANSVYGELIASTTTAITICGIAFNNASNVNQDFEIDIATGAAASETVVATFRGVFKSATGGFPLVIMLPLPISNIPNGTRVAFRVRKDSTTTTVWSCALYYYASATPGPETTVKLLKNIPTGIAATAASGYISITPSATDSANSAWNATAVGLGTDVTAPLQLKLAGIAINAGIGGVNFEIDVGTGAAGSEVVATTVRSYSGVAGGPHIIWFPPLLIQGSTRLALRLRKTGVDVTVWNCGLIYYEN